MNHYQRTFLTAYYKKNINLLIINILDKTKLPLKYFWGLWLIYLPILESQAQDIPLGTWRTHFSYLSAREVAWTSERVYCASDNGLFYLDKSDNSLNTLSKIDGLSETSIRAMAFDNQSQTLVLAYQNSTLDLIDNEEISEISLIRDANIAGSKNLNQIFFNQNLAYIAADFGLVVLDLNRRQIRETFQNLGINGANLAVQALTISRDSLVLATAQGIIIGALRDNLLDFNNWKRFSPSNGLPNGAVRKIVTRNNVIYALLANGLIYKYLHQNQWTLFNFPATNLQNLQISQNKILVSAPNRVYQIDENENISEISNSLIISPQSAFLDPQNRLWIADNRSGLVSNFSGTFQNFAPNGPARADTWSLYQYQDQILGLSGGFDENYNPLNRTAGFYQFRPAVWSNFNGLNTPNLLNIRDLTKAVYNRTNRNVYLASFGDGIVQRTETGNFSILNQNTAGTTLVADNQGKIRVGGLATDRVGDVWISTFAAANQPALHVLRSNGTWQSYSPMNLAARTPQDILIDNQQVKWIRLSPNRGGGIWVFDERTNRNRYLSSNANEGNLPSINVNALVQDLEGQLWIGTDRGVTVISNPNRVFEGAINAFTPIFESRPLLRAEVVTALAVDGGNRKWIGTRNGLWLFSADGGALVSYFNVNNSPLPDNVILDIKIEPSSGEVFVATAQGIVSYRGTATVGNAEYGQVKVFPNPVRPDFTGLVGISGLVEGANVKITDASGRLFYETRAQGGTATWNLRDYNNVKAQTGIYLIFSTNADGTQTLVSKIAVVE
ncbi:MAG: T9SS type A sorting domain-containing protein [Microscillaceae bacterium]|jgi:ligand-binding sensor domain-containing protein|nr:T9SS type A sorting domain-containing protein [Microscillaceae bacterium]